MGLNPSAVDEELVDLMKQVGFRGVGLGAEAGCDAMLSSLGKNFKKEDLLRAGRLLRERNIPTAWFLLVGAPGETEQTLRETFDTVSQAASRWDPIIIGVGIRVYNGAPITKQIKQENLNSTDNDFLHPLYFSPKSLNLDVINALTKQAAFNYPNFLIYNEMKPQDSVVKIGSSLLTIFARIRIKTQGLVFKLFVLLRTVQKFLGISLVRRLLFEYKNRKLFSDLKLTKN
jgi:radical SAM superfamily enzyme YgiQ (UPF0313 family)